ncbi:MAG: NADH-quinone oxidoreductase subunit J [Thermoflavifilum sp.]|nr:NADH-quinone oxidoreductase subunit J [Thermoflavifilum sp.]
MNLVFYIAALVAIFATLRAVLHKHAVHALLYLIVSLLSVAVIFFILGAPFLAALEVIIYAGAIMVLFVFVVMMLNRGEAAVQQEKEWFRFRTWAWPSVLVLILFVEWVYMLWRGSAQQSFAGVTQGPIQPQQVGELLFTQYLLGVEMAAMMLMAGIIGAYHIGKQKQKSYHRYLEEKSDQISISENKTQEVI